MGAPYIDISRLRVNYLLAARSRVLLEKLTGFQLVKKFPAFYGTRRFIIAVTSARYLYPKPARSIPCLPHHNFWRAVRISSSHLRLGLPSSLYPSGFPTKTLYKCLPSPHMCYMRRPSHSSRFYHPSGIGWGVQIIKPFITSCIIVNRISCGGLRCAVFCTQAYTVNNTAHRLQDGPSQP